MNAHQRRKARRLKPERTEQRIAHLVRQKSGKVLRMPRKPVRFDILGYSATPRIVDDPSMAELNDYFESQERNQREALDELIRKTWAELAQASATEIRADSEAFKVGQPVYNREPWAPLSADQIIEDVKAFLNAYRGDAPFTPDPIQAIPERLPPLVRYVQRLVSTVCSGPFEVHAAGPMSIEVICPVGFQQPAQEVLEGRLPIGVRFAVRSTKAPESP